MAKTRFWGQFEQESGYAKSKMPIFFYEPRKKKMVKSCHNRPRTFFVNWNKSSFLDVDHFQAQKNQKVRFDFRLCVVCF